MTWENMIYYFVGNQLRRNDNILLWGNFKGMIISIKNIGISLRFSVLMEVSPLLTAFHFSRLMWRPSSQWRKQKMQFKECYWWPTSAIPWKSKVVHGAGILLLPNIQIVLRLWHFWIFPPREREMESVLVHSNLSVSEKERKWYLCG